MLDPLETYKIAIEIGKMYLTLLQFFVAICSLFGGWIVINGLPRGILTRFLLSITFFIPTVSIVFGMATLSKRADSAIYLARKTAEAQGVVLSGESVAMFRISPESPYPGYEILGMIFVSMGICALILFSKVNQVKPKANETAISEKLFEAAVACQRKNFDREVALESFANFLDGMKKVDFERAQRDRID